MSRLFAVPVIGVSSNLGKHIGVCFLVFFFFSSNVENLQINRQKITYDIWVTLK